MNPVTFVDSALGQVNRTRQVNRSLGQGTRLKGQGTRLIVIRDRLSDKVPELYLSRNSIISLNRAYCLIQDARTANHIVGDEWDTPPVSWLFCGGCISLKV